MRTRRLVLSLGLVAAAAFSGLPASATTYALQPVATGLNEPVHITHAGDGSGRLFIVERAGLVKIVQNGQLSPDPFIDLRLLVGPYFLEQGLLSIAFHPAFATNGFVFVSYTDRVGQNVVARYRVDPNDPNRLDPSSAVPIFTQAQPFLNHNGGLILFGPDGYLYMGIGDGGVGNDPWFSGQNASTLLGTILRLDVDSAAIGYTVPPSNPFVGDPQAADEIWAYGLRNPWRFSFDRATGDLYIADVGQNRWEEVNVQPAGSAGGENYGWNRYEGHEVLLPEVIPPHTPYVFPELVYGRSEGCSVTGGHVYRGPSLTGLTGSYLFGDYCRGTIWRLTKNGSTYGKAVVAATQTRISSFGEDEAGEIYVADFGLATPGAGAVYKLVSN